MVLGCLDESGAATDGFTILKKDSGYQYFVYNPSTAAFELSPYTLDQTSNGAIMKTLAPLWDKSKNESIAMAFYNDDPPVTSESSSYAHAKGVLATDSGQGFWLVHSMPNWPMSPQGKDGANSPGILPNEDYGQSFRCVTVTQATVESIAEALRVDDPLVYEGYIPTSMEGSMPSMRLLIDKDQRTDINNTVATFNSAGDTAYFQFAKSKTWDKDLWDDLIAPYFETALYVETWIKGGGGRQSSICNTSSQNSAHPKSQPYDIFQVDLVQMPNGDTWKNTEDHSKYCVSTQSDNKVTCVGDINRMCSQERRGGGALCVQDEGLHTAFTAVVDSVEACYAEDPCVKWDCYYCGHTPGPTSEPSYAPPVNPPSYAPNAPPHPTPVPTHAPNGLTPAPSKGNSTAPVDINSGSEPDAVAIAVGVSCSVISLIICALLYRLYRKKQAEKSSRAWLQQTRSNSQLRNSLEGRNWLTDELTSGGGGSGHKASSVRSSLDGGSTFGDYLPPEQSSEGGGGGVTVTSMESSEVVNPLSDPL